MIRDRKTGLWMPRDPLCSMFQATHLTGFGVGASAAPTGQQPLWDSATKDANITLDLSDRRATLAASQAGSARSVVGVAAGKWYVEATWGTTVGGNNPRYGIVLSTQSMSNYGPGSNTSSWVLVFESGNKQTNGSSTAYGDSSSSSDIIMMAADMDAGKVWWGENGSWYNSGDPAAGTGEAFSGISGTIHILMGRSANTGDKNVELADVTAYTHPVPSGFLAGWGS